MRCGEAAERRGDMKVRGALVLACLVGIVATGCVPLKPYEDVKEKLAQAKDINLAADRKLRQADQELVELRERIKQLESRGTGAGGEDEIRILEKQLEDMRASRDALLEKLAVLGLLVVHESAGVHRLVELPGVGVDTDLAEKGLGAEGARLVRDDGHDELAQLRVLEQLGQ